MGSWCGYVAVPPGHPAWGRDYNDVEVEVHGGLTYANMCDGARSQGICHVPAEGEAANVWWLGFDCGHAYDVVPSMTEFALPNQIYRDLAYVRNEVNSLADQLAAAVLPADGGIDEWTAQQEALADEFDRRAS